MCMDAWCIPFSPHKVFFMPECWTIRHLVIPIPELKKMAMPEPVLYGNKGVPFRCRNSPGPECSSTGRLGFWPEMPDPGMPLPVKSATIPVPCFAVIAMLADEGHKGGTSSNGSKKMVFFPNLVL